MSKSQTHTELLNIQMNAESQTNSNYSSYKFLPIDNTPFYLKGSDDEGFQAVLGNHIITPTFNTEKELTAFINEKPYELLINISCAVYDQLKRLGHDQIQNKGIPKNDKEKEEKHASTTEGA